MKQKDVILILMCFFLWISCEFAEVTIRFRISSNLRSVLPLIAAEFPETSQLESQEIWPTLAVGGCVLPAPDDNIRLLPEAGFDHLLWLGYLPVI